MVSLLIFLFILGILIIVHEWGHFIMAKRVGVRVEKFSLGFGPPVAAKKRDDTEYVLSAIPLGGYVKLAGDNLEEYKGQPDEYFSKPPGERAKIVFFGPLLNYILGFACFCFIFFVGYPTLTAKVGGVLDGFGAKEAGIQAGDKIVAVDDEPINSWEDLQYYVHTKKAAAVVKVSVIRGDTPYDFYVKIKERELDNAVGQKRKVGLLGITPSQDDKDIIIARHGFIESFALGLRKTWGLTVLTYKALWSMITGKVSFKESVTGPLGIFFITSQAARHGIIALLHLIAVLNVSLAIFNMLPFPVLDGGHIALLAFEKIRGKCIGVRTERIITQIGLTAIITLALIVTYNDIAKFKDTILKWFIK